MNTKRIALVTKEAQMILERVEKLEGQNMRIYKGEGDVAYSYFLDNVDILITKFNELVSKANKLFEEEELDEELSEIELINAPFEKIREEKVIFNPDGKLMKIAFDTTKILTFLTEGIVLSESSQDKLEGFRNELKELKESINPQLYDNILEACITFERGGFLGSSLICGRVIRYCLDQINGKDINERIQTLKDNGIIKEKDGVQFILKANHFARNLTSHELKIIPISSEALSFLGDATKIIRIMSQYEQIVSIEKKE